MFDQTLTNNLSDDFTKKLHTVPAQTSLHVAVGTR